MVIFAGLDWGTSKIAMATWDNERRCPELVSPHGADFLPAAVGFRRDNQRNAIPIYPVDDSSQELSFADIKRRLPSFRDSIAARFIIESIFRNWRGYVSHTDVHCTISVPVDYSSRECDWVQQAGTSAGFTSCSYVSEPLAVVLACLPSLFSDRTKWGLLEAGRTIWVLDCGSIDLNLALIHVVRIGDSLNFSFLAGDCLEELGSVFCDSPSPESVDRQFNESFPNVTNAAFARLWSNWNGPRPELRKADWAISAGGGANLSVAVDALRRRIPDLQLLNRGLESTALVAFGACVHAAIQGGQVPYRIGVVRRRMVLGLTTELGNARFIPISRAEDEVPFSFERIFELPKQASESNEIEVTLAAAFPGGDRFGGLATYIADRAKLGNEQAPGFLLKGRMESWEGGNVELYELGSGTKLWEAPFHLP